MRYFAPFLVLLLVVALWFRVEFFFTLLYFLIAIRVLTEVWMRRVASRLLVVRRFTDRAFTGDRTPVRLVVENRSRLPILWLEVDETVPLGLRSAPLDRQVIALGSRARWQRDYTLVCQRRGRYTIGPSTLRAGDPLGLARQQLRSTEPRDLIVYPRVVSLARLGLPTHSPLATLPTIRPLFEDPARITGVRAYQPGDPPRRIHWRATARSGQVLVKQYQPAIARETLICLDLFAEDYLVRYRHDAIELAITVAASLANHIIVREGQAAGLTCQAADPAPGATRPADRANPLLPPRRERSHLIGILELLAEVEMTSDPARPFGDLVRRERLGLPWGGTLIAITGQSTPELLEPLLQLRRGGLAVALILIGARRSDESILLPGVTLYRVQTTADLEALI